MGSVLAKCNANVHVAPLACKAGHFFQCTCENDKKLCRRGRGSKEGGCSNTEECTCNMDVV